MIVSCSSLPKSKIYGFGALEALREYQIFNTTILEILRIMALNKSNILKVEDDNQKRHDHES